MGRRLHQRSIQSRLTLSGSLSLRLIPAQQDRGWKTRWQQIEQDLNAVMAPQPAPMNADTIHAAHHALQSFYIQAYHLKDALKAEAGTTGVPAKKVENAISTEPTLALLADLSNLDKHAKPDAKKYPPRTGAVPVVQSISGDTVGLPEGFWQLRVEINHNGQVLDGLQIAQDAVATWRRILCGWRLI